MAVDILVIDDEEDIRELVADILEDEGYNTRTAKDGVSALAAIKQRRPSLVILDVWLGDSERDGFKILEIIKRDHELVPVIMMSGHGTIETAVNAIKFGAYDFLEKPFKTEKLLLTIRRALESARLKRENSELRLKNGMTNITQEQIIIKTSKIRQQVEDAKTRKGHLFLYGETGSGKETIARELYSNGNLSSFHSFNCASCHDTQVEAEIFGTEIQLEDKNIPRKIGLIEQSHGGILYLEEIDHLPSGVQSKINNFLVNGKFSRMGSTEKLDSTIRIVASSTKSPHELTENNLIHADLLYRLSSVTIKVPPLRERSTELPEMLTTFMTAAAQAKGVQYRKFTQEAVAILQAYQWPGNLNQLKNMIDWLLIMENKKPGEPVTKEMLPDTILSGNSFTSDWQMKSAEMIVMPLRQARESFEKEYLMAQIQRFDGNISQTARFIGMERSALHRKLRALGVSDYKN